MKLQTKFLNQLLIDIKMVQKNRWKIVSLSSIIFIYCIINGIKNLNRGRSYIAKKATINPINKKNRKYFI